MEADEKKSDDTSDYNGGVGMKSVIIESAHINEHIKNTEEYKSYLNAKNNLYSHEELFGAFREFRAKNYELQNRVGVNPYDEVSALVNEYDELLHNSIVSDFIRAEQNICKMMQRVYNTIAEGLEFDYPDE